MKLVDVNCYACGATANAPYASENGFTLVKCANCGLLYVRPRPSDADVASAHRIGVHPGSMDVTGSYNAHIVPRYMNILADIHGTPEVDRTCNWLDVGCGHGEFMQAVQHFMGPQADVHGLEPNTRKRESARSHGLKVEWFDLWNHTGAYDYVSLLNVYSHLPDPVSFLKLCHGLLKQGGELWLETGDTAGLPASQHPRPFYLPDHLSFASESIVRTLLQRCGFEVVQLRKYSAFPFECDTLRWIKEAIKVVWPGKTSQFPDMIAARRKSRRYITDMYIRAVKKRGFGN